MEQGYKFSQGEGSEVQFQNVWRPSASDYSSGSPRIVRWLVRHSFGILKTEQQAGIFLIAASLALIIFSILLLAGAFGGGGPTDSEYSPKTKYQGRILPDSYR